MKDHAIPVNAIGRPLRFRPLLSKTIRSKRVYHITHKDAPDYVLYVGQGTWSRPAASMTRLSKLYGWSVSDLRFQFVTVCLSKPMAREVEAQMIQELQAKGQAQWNRCDNGSHYRRWAPLYQGQGLFTPIAPMPLFENLNREISL